MKRFLKKLIEYMLVIYFVLTIFNGIVLPQSLVYILSTFSLFAIAVFLSSALLGFLTIKENFLTKFVMSSLLCFGVFYLIVIFMPGFQIEEYVFEGIDTGSLVINSFNVTEILTMVFGSITYSLITSLLGVLEKSS